MLAATSPLDLVLLCILALFLVRGIMRGLVAEIAGFAGVALGIWGASTYQGEVFPFLELVIGHPGWARIAAYLVLFIGIFLLVGLGLRLLQKLLDFAYAGGLNRLAGGVLGLIKGAIVALVLFFLVDTFLPKAEFLQTSQLAPYAREYAGMLKDVVLDYAEDLDDPTDFLNGGNESRGNQTPPQESTPPDQEMDPLQKYPPQPIKPPSAFPQSQGTQG